MGKFTREEVVVKRVLVEQQDAYGPNCISMSVMRECSSSIKLVVGADWENRGACYLSKSGLAELIEELKLIHEAM